MKYLLVFILLLSLVSCSSTKPSESVNTTTLANPFVDCGSLIEAERLAGFSISIPNNLINSITNYRVLNTTDKMIELLCGDELVIRKANITGDISGLYYDFNDNLEVNINSNRVQLRGNDGIYYSAIWTNNGFSYSLSIKSGESKENFESLIVQIN